jgi:hypothetical protein
MNPHYPAVAMRAAHRCEYCREAVFNFPFEVEHVAPRSAGGSDDESNLALACRACNLRKSDHVAGIDLADGSEVRLYHPREDRWEDHFAFDAEAGAIHGTTPTGRVTVLQLDMNSDSQVAARKQWQRLGLYP